MLKFTLPFAWSFKWSVALPIILTTALFHPQISAYGKSTIDSDRHIADWNIAVIFWVAPGDNSILNEDVQQQLKEIQKLQFMNAPLGSKLGIFIPKNNSLSQNIQDSLQFLTQQFSGSTSRNVLFIYGHGEGPTGFQSIPLSQSRRWIQTLMENQIQLEWVWFDACYLASAEWIYEWRDVTENAVGSSGPLFSAGSPYSFLQMLLDPITAALDTRSVLSLLLADAIASYSYSSPGAQNGVQKNSVESSPATLSWISIPNLQTSIPFFQKLQNKLVSIKKIISAVDFFLKGPEPTPSTYGLTDIGLLIAEAKKHSLLDPELDSQSLNRFETLNSTELQQSSIELNIPKSDSPDSNGGSTVTLGIVYGYEGFSRGHQQDNSWANGFGNYPLFDYSSDYFSDYTSGDSGDSNDMEYFVDSRTALKWPILKLSNEQIQNKRIQLFPFTPQTRLFQIFWVEQNPTTLQWTPISPVQSFSPSQDFVARWANQDTQIVQFFGYTHSTNPWISNWSGLSILNPFSSTESVDYFDLFFVKESNWHTH